MNKRSEAALAEVSPVLADRVRTAAAQLAQAGTFLLVVSGFHTAQEQNSLFSQGRTAPGHIVTNARAGQSMHNYGLAVDVVPYLQGDSGQVNWRSNTAQFRAMVAALDAQDLVWGDLGRVSRTMITSNCQGGPLSPTAEMQADYGTGNSSQLQRIWQNVAEGVYAV